VRFVLTEHPTRGRWILLCTDLTLDASDIVHLYGLRFKIEVGFKQAEHVIGAYDYHFWMKAMKPLKRGNGNQYLHREDKAYRDAIRRKIHAYHVFMFMGVVAQGLMQYLSACYSELVVASFGSWLCTTRKDVSPSELMVRTAMQNTLADFLSVRHKANNWAKFINERQDRSRATFWRKAV